MRRNKLREKLDAGQPTICTCVHSTWPSLIEMIGLIGVYDYVEFDAEYVPYDLRDLDGLGRAADLAGLSAMIKIDQEPRRIVAQRAVGSGFHSVLFADVRSVEDARECVRCVRPETPADGGTYGAARRRMAYGADVGGPAYAQALRNVVVALMIEKQPAVEQLDDILALDGVDLIQFGPTDYSMSIGRLGGKRSAEVKAVERRVIESCLRAGVPTRAEITSVDQAQYYLDLGVSHFSLGTDIVVLCDWLKEHGEKLQQAVSGA